MSRQNFLNPGNDFNEFRQLADRGSSMGRQPTSSIRGNKPPTSKKRLILNAFLILFILALLVGGGYWLSKYNQKKKAADYLEQEIKNFNEVAAGINVLETEDLNKKDNDDEDNNDLIIKEMEEEVKKLEKEQTALEKAVKYNQSVKTNELMTGTQWLFADFYKEADALTKEYNESVEYQLAAGKITNDFEKEMEQLRIVFQGASSREEVVNLYRGLQDKFGKLANDLKQIDPPSNFKESHTSMLQFLNNFGLLVGQFASAVEASDDNRMQSIDRQISMEFENVGKVKQLEEYYNEKLSERFGALRTKAEKVNTEILLWQSDLKIEQPRVVIEVW